jgi:hypothetical protein
LLVCPHSYTGSVILSSAIKPMPTDPLVQPFNHPDWIFQIKGRLVLVVMAQSDQVMCGLVS